MRNWVGMTTFPPVFTPRDRNITVGNVRLPPGFRRGWDITVRNVRMVHIGVFLTFLRVVELYIGEIGGVET